MFGVLALWTVVFVCLSVSDLIHANFTYVYWTVRHLDS